jgi:hypothetical protein
MRLRSALVALALSPSCGGDPPAPPGVNVLTGTLPLYRTQGSSPRQDVSGASYIPALEKVLLVDDGGEPGKDAVPFYLLDGGNNFKLGQMAQGMLGEAATFDGTFAYVTSGLYSPTGKLSGPEPKDSPYIAPKYRAFSRFKLEGDKPVGLETIDPREALVAALAAFDAAWWARVKDLEPWMDGRGVLAVEGLTATPTPGKLLVGLRSPRHGPDFAPPGAPSQRGGAALLIEVDVTAFSPGELRPRVSTLDLGGYGVRSIEHSPTAGGYFISAGALEDHSRDFALYFWRGPGSAPVALALEAFKELCRPEAITEMVHGGKRYLLILSEESGDVCADPTPRYSYILVELNPAFLATLK